jgi:mRNA capping enzyme
MIRSHRQTMQAISAPNQPSNPSIALDPIVSDSLQALVNKAIESFVKASADTDIELEVRIGRPKAFNQRSCSWSFDSSIEPETFHNLKKKLDAMVAPRKIEQVSSTISSKLIDSSQLRHIQTLSNALDLVQKKTELSVPVDQNLLTVNPNTPIQSDERNVYMIRFSLASEWNQPKSSDLFNTFNSVKQQAVIRRRERFSYPLDSYGMIELTIVDGKDYSIEFEYSREFLQSLVGSPALKDRRMLFTGHLLPPLKRVFAMLWPGIDMLGGISQVTKAYCGLIDISTGGTYRTDPQPRNIAESEVSLIAHGYAFTNKLNGTKYRLMLNVFNYLSDHLPMAWLVSRTDLRFIGIIPDEIVKYLRSGSKQDIGTLIDVELWMNPETNAIELHAMNCPVFLGSNKTLIPLEERLAFVESISETINRMIKYKFEVKQFFSSGNAVEDLQNVVRYMYGRYGVNTERYNDGLIMEPVGRTAEGRAKSYYDSERKYPTFKWKWPEAVSIDFKLEQIQGFSRADISYAVFKLMLWDKTRLVQFGPYKRDGKFYNPPGVFIIAESEPEFVKLKDGLIAEFGFNRKSNSFILLRVRDDKTEPNNLFPTGQATFVDMYVEFSLQRLQQLLEKALGRVQPRPTVTEAKIQPQTKPAIVREEKRIEKDEDCLRNYRQYNNSIKAGLIQHYAKSARVLDLGAGEGGDLWKELEARTSMVWAVEPNKEFVHGQTGFLSRLETVASKGEAERRWAEHVEVIESRAEDTSFIAQRMKDTVISGKAKEALAQVTTSFFSMSFFFSNKKTLDSFAQTVGTLLEIGGKFIGTMMDGYRVYNELKNGNVTEDCYSIRRMYDENKSLGFGNEIIINLGNTPTVIGDQKEWLAPFNLLEDALRPYNVELVQTRFLDDDRTLDTFRGPYLKRQTSKQLFDSMSESEKRLVGMYRYFVFEKREISKKEAVKEAAKALERERSKNRVRGLKPDEGEEFSVSIYSEPLERVGMIGDGSCFYHTLLFLIINAKYLALSSPKRRALTGKVRKALADALSPQTFSQLAGGSLESAGALPFIERELKESLITNVEAENEIPNITEAELKKIVENAEHLGNIQQQIIEIKNSLSKYGYSSDDLDPIIEQGRLTLWENYRSKLRDCSSYADHDTIEYVMRTLKRNIFIIEDETRLPVLFTSCDLYNPSWSSIVVLLLKENEHYEALVYTKRDNEGNDLETTFNWPWSSHLIQSLYDWICKSKK